MEKRAKSEGLLAVLQSQNRGESFDEASNSNLRFEMHRENSQLGLSDDDSVLTDTAAEGGVNENAMGITAMGLEDSVEGTAAGVGTVDSTFSAEIEPKGTTKGKFLDQEAIAEEEPSPQRANITYLSEEEEKEEEKLAKNSDGEQDEQATEVVPVPTISTETTERGSLDIEVRKTVPVAAGSGYTFAKQQSGSAKEPLSPNEESVEDATSDVPSGPVKSASEEGEDKKITENAVVGPGNTEIVVREQTCVINNDVITVKVYSDVSVGTTTLRAYNNVGENTLTYQLIPALASQLKELSDEETNKFLTEMINSTVVIPSDSTNMGTEYAADATLKVSSNEDDKKLEDTGCQSSKSVVDEVYEVSVKDVTYSSRLEFKDDGVVEIHASNTDNGRVHVIPLLPVLAKQIVTLTYNQVAGVISDIIKTFTGP